MVRRGPSRLAIEGRPNALYGFGCTTGLVESKFVREGMSKFMRVAGTGLAVEGEGKRRWSGGGASVGLE